MSMEQKRFAARLLTGLLLSEEELELADEGFQLISCMDSLAEGTDPDEVNYEVYDERFYKHLSMRDRTTIATDVSGRRVKRTAGE